MRELEPWEVANALRAQLAKQDAEVERLRAENEDWRRQSTERERLKKAVAGIGVYEAQYVEVLDELERLRPALSAADNEKRRLEAEIERLRVRVDGYAAQVRELLAKEVRFHRIKEAVSTYLDSDQTVADLDALRAALGEKP